MLLIAAFLSHNDRRRDEQYGCFAIFPRIPGALVIDGPGSGLSFFTASQNLLSRPACGERSLCGPMRLLAFETAGQAPRQDHTIRRIRTTPSGRAKLLPGVNW